MACRQPGSFNGHNVHQTSDRHPHHRHRHRHQHHHQERLQQQQQQPDGRQNRWAAAADSRPLLDGGCGTGQDTPTPQTGCITHDVGYRSRHPHPTSFGHARGGLLPFQRLPGPDPCSEDYTRFGVSGSYPSHPNRFLTTSALTSSAVCPAFNAPQGANIPLTQSLPQSLPQSMPQSLPQSLPQSMPQSLPQSMPQSMPRSLYQSMPQSLPQSMPQSMPRSLYQSMPQSLPQFMPQSLPQSLPQSVPQSLPQSMPQSMPHLMPQSLSQSLHQSLHRSMFQSMPSSVNSSSRQFRTGLPQEGLGERGPNDRDPLHGDARWTPFSNRPALSDRLDVQLQASASCVSRHPDNSRNTDTSRHPDNSRNTDTSRHPDNPNIVDVSRHPDNSGNAEVSRHPDHLRIEGVSSHSNISGESDISGPSDVSNQPETFRQPDVSQYSDMKSTPYSCQAKTARIPTSQRAGQALCDVSFQRQYPQSRLQQRGHYRPTQQQQEPVVFFPREQQQLKHHQSRLQQQEHGHPKVQQQLQQRQPNLQQQELHQSRQQQQQEGRRQEDENYGWEKEDSHAHPFSGEYRSARYAQLPAAQQQRGLKVKAGSVPGEVSMSRSEESDGNREAADVDSGSVKKQAHRESSAENSLMQEKKVRVEEMRKSVLEMFPNIHRQSYSVPPIRLSATKYSQLAHLSSNRHDVREQREKQPAALLGDQTEDTITRFVAQVAEAVDEPMFLLSSYSFDDYLFYMEKKDGKSKDGRSERPAMIPADPELLGSSSSSKVRRKALFQGPPGKSDEVADPGGSERNGEKGPVSSEGRSTDGSGHQLDLEADQWVTEREGCGAEPRLSASWSSLPCKYMFPSPRDLDPKSRRGDFDNLIISPRHGFIVIEAKTMLGRKMSVPQGERFGENQPERVPEIPNKHVNNLCEDDRGPQTAALGCETETQVDSQAFPKLKRETETPSDPSSLEENSAESAHSPLSKDDVDEEFWKTIRKSLDQLRKAETVLRHVTSDLAEVAITKVLGLPNTPAVALRRLLEDPALSEDCFEVLDTGTVEETLSHCITADLVAELHFNASLADITRRDATCGDMTRKLQQWWRALVEGRPTRKVQQIREEETAVWSECEAGDEGHRMLLSWDVYEQIVSRFCGKDSRVPSRTVADCIHLTGVSFGSSILRKDQLALLETASPFFFLVGPPGSGKTLLLALKAAEWAKKGDHVVVVSMTGVCTGTLVSWTLYDRVVEAVEDFRVKEMKRTLAMSAEGDEKNAQRKRSSKGQSRRRKEQTKTSVCKAQTKSSVCKPHDVDDNTELEEAQRTPIEFESQPAGFTSSATSSSLQNSSPRTGESLRAADGTPVSEHFHQNENVRPLVDNANDSNVTASNVHQAFISAETDVDKLVTDVLAKYKDTPVRFIVDECLRQYTEDYVFSLFSKAQVSLDRMKSLYRDIVERVAGGSGAAWRPWRADAWRERQERASALAPDRRASPGRAEEDTSITPETGSGRDEIPGQNDQSRLASEDSSHQRLNPKDSEKNRWPKDASCDGIRTNNSDNAESARDSFRCERLNPKDPEKKSPASDASGEGLDPKDYFITMDDRMDKLTARFRQLHAGSPGGPRLLHSARWRHDVDQMSRTFRSVQTLKTQAFTFIESATSHEDLTESLEELARLTVSVMGNLFLAYNSLAFFQLDQLFNTVRESARDSRRPPELCVSLWSASVYPNYCPAGYDRGTLVNSIRCPPTLQKILKWTEKDVMNPLNYYYITRGCDVNPPLPSDGPPVTWFDHSSHMTSSREVNDCARCGKALVDHLINTLGLQTLAECHKTKGKGCSRGQGRKNQLYFHDVMICGSPIHQPGCAFIQELKQGGITLQYESQTLTSPPPYIDKVFVAGGSTVLGLEAKIVVYVPEQRRITEEKAASTHPTSTHPTSTPTAATSTPTATTSTPTAATSTPTAVTSTPTAVTSTPTATTSTPTAATSTPPSTTSTPTATASTPHSANATPSVAPTTTSPSASPPRSATSSNGPTTWADEKLCHSHTDADAVSAEPVGQGQGAAEVKATAEKAKEATGVEKQREEDMDKESSLPRGMHPQQTAQGVDRLDEKLEKFSVKDLEERERLRRLGAWNRDYIWQVASRSTSHVVIFHF